MIHVCNYMYMKILIENMEKITYNICETRHIDREHAYKFNYYLVIC